MRSFNAVFRGKRVLVTGHTGFKGAWLCEWLLQLGAEVAGYALAPLTKPALFEQLALAQRLRHVVGDVRDLPAVRELVEGFRPEFIFHLAAQPLVRKSYADPVATYGTNVMGSVSILEAARLAGSACVVIVVTTDKCYENREWVQGYREEDQLGGHDPYSSSKAAAEIVTAAYRRSFFSGSLSLVRVASARAGNVIGGGDWSEDRIVPDCVRALQTGRDIMLRNPRATRPWQHVLEPVSGYLCLAARLSCDPSGELCSAFNFGPSLSSNRSVAELVDEVLRHWPGRWKAAAEAPAVHEAGRLGLATDKAFHVLKWKGVWEVDLAVARTIAWYKSAHSSAQNFDAGSYTRAQISQYADQARSGGLPWANE